MRVSGKVGVVDLSKKAATMNVDIAGQPVVMQIGPIIRGNSIRDAASFINFDDFKNQVQFARLSKELNKKAMANFTRPDESWTGAEVDVLAAVTIKDNAVAEAIPLEITKR
jgi:predicted lipoprotein